MSDTLAAILDDLTACLQHEIEEGRRTVHVDRELLKAKNLAPGAAPVAAAPVAPRVQFAVRDAPEQPVDDTPSGRQGRLARVAAEIALCEKCILCKARKKTVPGQGSPTPEIMFVGEGPGEDEDTQGLAFVGAAGQLLTRMIKNLGLTREEVFIANVVKCRPPGNRNPAPVEMAACLPYLKAQLAILRPRVIVALGTIAVKALLDPKLGVTRARGHWFSYEGVDVMPTFHPSYVLRDESGQSRWDVWEDMVKVLERIGRALPPGAPKRRPQRGK